MPGLSIEQSRAVESIVKAMLPGAVARILAPIRRESMKLHDLLNDCSATALDISTALAFESLHTETLTGPVQDRDKSSESETTRCAASEELIAAEPSETAFTTEVEELGQVKIKTIAPPESPMTNQAIEESIANQGVKCFEVISPNTAKAGITWANRSIAE